MATSFGALCTDFYINHKLTVRMDLPAERETVLHLFDRVRAEIPSMSRFRRYPDEFSLESSRKEGAYRWLALQQNSVRTGQVNPETLEEAYGLHRLLMRLSPYHLTISPLDIEHQELLLGFDLETKANQHQIVREALFDQTPMARLLEAGESQPTDLQPIFGVSLDAESGLQAFFEVKASTGFSQIRHGRYRTEPLSVMLTVRRSGPVDSVDDLVSNFDLLKDHAERLATDRLIPDLLNPISRCITHSA
ncbi:MAG: hypothetical protein R3236_04835 [Phycisphaeraceae bacterium]|nr:hypothetical protein [Phycisphaeraceae bacterium]